MNRRYSLKKNRQFQYVYRRGKSAACREMVLLYVRAPRVQVGFSVSKKIGNAVVRNRTKRRLREAVRPLLPRMKCGLYVVIARQDCVRASFPAICRSLSYVLKKQNLFREGTP